MKPALALLALGSAALLAQGVAVEALPPRLVPALGFLVVVGVGLHAPPVSGALVAIGLGYLSDVLSGSLLGQHALLTVASFALTRVANRQLNLRGVLPRAVYVGVLTMGYGFGLGALSWLFGEPPVVDGGLVAHVAQHAAVNALCAPAVGSAVERVTALLSDDETGRPVRLAPRRPVA